MTETQPDAIAEAEAITRMPPERVADFIRTKIDSRQLHPLVARLNEQAMSPSDQARVASRKALRHLGFI